MLEASFSMHTSHFHHTKRLSVHVNSVSELSTTATLKP